MDTDSDFQRSDAAALVLQSKKALTRNLIITLCFLVGTVLAVLAAVGAGVELKNLRQQKEELHASIIDLTKKQADVSKKLEVVQGQLDEKAAALKNANVQIDSLKKATKDAEDQAKAAEERRGKAEAAAAKAEAELNGKNQELAKSTTELETTSSLKEQLLKDVDFLKDEKTKLLEANEKYKKVVEEHKLESNPEVKSAEALTKAVKPSSYQRFITSIVVHAVDNDQLRKAKEKLKPVLDTLANTVAFTIRDEHQSGGAVIGYFTKEHSERAANIAAIIQKEVPGIKFANPTTAPRPEGSSAVDFHPRYRLVLSKDALP